MFALKLLKENASKYNYLLWGNGIFSDLFSSMSIHSFTYHVFTKNLTCGRNYTSAAHSMVSKNRIDSVIMMFLI